jgi:hypothetical protein
MSQSLGATQDSTLSFKREGQVFELGSIISSGRVGKTSRDDGHFNEYRSTDWGDRISIKRKAKDIFNTGFKHRKERIHFGIVAHEVLSKIHNAGQLEEEVKRLHSEGLLSETELQELKDQLEKLLANPAIQPWFDAGWHVRTESPILTSRGHEWKPDRILTRGDTAVVIDFKTGVEKEAHKDQVRTYRNLIEDMGYKSVSSYLLYISKNKVVEVL